MRGVISANHRSSAVLTGGSVKRSAYVRSSAKSAVSSGFPLPPPPPPSSPCPASSGPWAPCWAVEGLAMDAASARCVEHAGPHANRGERPGARCVERPRTCPWASSRAPVASSAVPPAASLPPAPYRASPSAPLPLPNMVDGGGGCCVVVGSFAFSPCNGCACNGCACNGCACNGCACNG